MPFRKAIFMRASANSRYFENENILRAVMKFYFCHNHLFMTYDHVIVVFTKENLTKAYMLQILLQFYAYTNIYDICMETYGLMKWDFKRTSVWY